MSRVFKFLQNSTHFLGVKWTQRNKFFVAFSIPWDPPVRKVRMKIAENCSSSWQQSCAVNAGNNLDQGCLLRTRLRVSDTKRQERTPQTTMIYCCGLFSHILMSGMMDWAIDSVSQNLEKNASVVFIWDNQVKTTEKMVVQSSPLFVNAVLGKPCPVPGNWKKTSSSSPLFLKCFLTRKLTASSARLVLPVQNTAKLEFLRAFTDTFRLILKSYTK